MTKEKTELYVHDFLGLFTDTPSPKNIEDRDSLLDFFEGGGVFTQATTSLK